MAPNFSGSKLILLNVAIGLGTFIQILDTSIANVAVPYIAGNLGVSADQGTWVITSFAASNAIVLPLTGWLSDYFGRVRLFVGSVLLFALISLLCGLSTTLTMLVTLRVVQGAVAGSLIPLSQSLIVAHNPAEKVGGALGFWASIVVVAPVLGPIIGGYLTEVYSWRWIFFINVPIGLFSAFFVWHFLHDQDTEIVRNPIDWVGLFLLSVGVGSLQIMLDKGRDLDWFDSPVILTLAITSAVSLLYFIIWNYYQKFPIVDFTFFKNRNFIFGTISITIGFLIYFGSSVTIPLWLQTEQGYTAYWAGLAIAPIGIIPVLFSTLIGDYMQRFDLRLVASLSFLLFSFGFFYQAHFTTQVDLSTLMWARFLQGFGILFFFLPLVQLSLGEIPSQKYASASGLFNFFRILVGSGFGTSLAIELWSNREAFHYERLAESISPYRPVISQFYTEHPEFAPGVTSRILDRAVEQQAFMLSTNELSWLGGLLFLALIPVIFLCKGVKKSESKVQVVH